MAKKVLIISGTPRNGGNSDILCDQFEKGAKEAGHEVERINLRERNIGFCKGCYACVEKGRCIINDDVPEIVDRMYEADAIVFASPVYFYSVDAQLKALIDRTVSRWTEIKGKEFYYIMTAAEDTDTVMDCTLECMRGLMYCLEGSVEKGVVYGKGVYERGDVIGTLAMDEAYEMGKSV